jgi:hypothetical protein
LTAILNIGLLAFALGGHTVHAAANDFPASVGYSAAALYNLANSDARSGKPGLAVLNYERARLLAPNDPDIQANLRFVRESVGLPAESGNWFSRNARIAHPNTMFWLGLVGLLLTGTSLLASRRISKSRLALGAACAAGIALMGLTICSAVAVWPTLHEAVVVAHAAAARVSPVIMGETLFSLPEAEIVTTGARHQDFVLIHTNDGRAGWISSADLSPVVP